MKESDIKMMSIWLMVAIAIGFYGLIVLGMGVYYIFVPAADTSKLAALNPSLWWGGIMVASALALVVLDRLTNKKSS